MVERISDIFRRKRITVLVVLAVLLFLYAALWTAYVAYRYEPFRKALGAGIGASQDILQEDHFTYSVHKPKPVFLSFTGNISITENIVVSAGLPEQVTVDLLVWPRGFDSYEVGIGIVETTTDPTGHTSNSYSHDMMLDENMDLLDDTPENRKLYEENIDKIKNIYRLAYEMWGILGTE